MLLADIIRRTVMFSLGVLIGMGSPLKASIIFSNLVGNVSGGQGVQGSDFSAQGSVAEAFVPTADFAMTDAEIEVFQDQGFGGDPLFNVSLYSNAGGKPGSLLASFGTALAAPVLGGTVVASSPQLFLTSGTEYWLVLTPFDAGTNIGWEADGSQSVPLALGDPTGNSWSADGTSVLQFQIDGSPVPEPTTWIPFTSGLALLACWGRRRKLLPQPRP